MPLTLRRTLDESRLKSYSKDELAEAICAVRELNRKHSTYSKAELLSQACEICQAMQAEHEAKAEAEAKAKWAQIEFEKTDEATQAMLSALLSGFEKKHAQLKHDMDTKFERMTESVQTLCWQASWDMEDLWVLDEMRDIVGRCHASLLHTEATMAEKLARLSYMSDELYEKAMSDRTHSTCLLTVCKDDCKRTASRKMAGLLKNVLTAAANDNGLLQMESSFEWHVS